MCLTFIQIIRKSNNVFIHYCEVYFILKKGWKNRTIIHLEPPKPCSDCPEELDHVCAADGITYDNKCKAECKYAQVQCKGKCPCGNYVIYYSNQTKRLDFLPCLKNYFTYLADWRKKLQPPHYKQYYGEKYFFIWNVGN